MKKTKKSTIMYALILMLCFVFTACGTAKGTTNETVSETVMQTEEVTSQEEAKSIATLEKDLAGYDITLPETIERIIVLAPSDAEILVALGMADKIIAIDSYSADIEGISQELPVFDIMTPDAEQLIAMNADVIFTTGMSSTDGEDVFQMVKDAGVCVVTTPSATSIDGIKESISFLAQVVGAEETGASIITEMESEIEAIQTISSTIEEKKNVYFEISAAPYCYSFGTGTFLNEMIEIIGAKNIYADQTDWISISEEDVIAKNPDVILTNVSYVEDPVGEILSRNAWDVVTAIAEKQVFQINDNASSRPSQNIIKALKEMAVAVYPEYFE
ncbi:MAG: ABC transporter substrate-binding protein [Lachnospiraceae bacterium]